MAGESLERKLSILMSLAADDRDGRPPPPRLRHVDDVGALRPLNIRDLRPAAGVRMKLLRILMTNACTFNCHYCPMRRDRALPRTLLKPEELVRVPHHRHSGTTSARYRPARRDTRAAP